MPISVTHLSEDGQVSPPEPGGGLLAAGRSGRRLLPLASAHWRLSVIASVGVPTQYLLKCHRENGWLWRVGPTYYLIMVKQLNATSDLTGGPPPGCHNPA